MYLKLRELFPLSCAGGRVDLQLQESKNVSVTAEFLRVRFSCQRNDSAEYRFCSALGVALGGSHHQQHMQTHPHASHTAPAHRSQIMAGSYIFQSQLWAENCSRLCVCPHGGG